MGFSPEMIATVRGDSQPEIDVLLAHAGLSPAGGIVQDARAPDPDRLFDIARLNKVLGWLPVGPAQLPPGCASLAPRLLQVRLRTMAMNQRAMAVTLEATEALREAGLRHVVFKGPFQQLRVHGDPFRRPSGDVDLYVAPRDRRQAGAVLQNLGFAPMEADRSLWWVSFLGEQHFRRDSDGAVIDLHHRLQQTGLPDWRGAETVLDRADSVTQGKIRVPIMSQADNCLLMAVSLAKALLAHEPCGWAATDLMHSLARLAPVERDMLTQVAAHGGQDRTLALGLAMARACGDYPVLKAGDRALLRGLPSDPAILRDLVFQPWQRAADAPRRRQILRMLAKGRPYVLAVEIMRAALSQQVRALLERRAAKASPR